MGEAAGDGGKWEDLRREARKLESDLDVKLSSYGKLGSMLGHGGYGDPGSPGPVFGQEGSWKSVEMEIEALLERLQDVNDGMATCTTNHRAKTAVDSTSLASPSSSSSPCTSSSSSTPSISQKLARHRAILYEYAQEFRRVRGNLASMREHAELVTSVRSDVADFKTSSSTGHNQLIERRAIHGSIVQIDDLINQAASTKAALSTQRSIFVDVRYRLKSLGERFPMIRSILGAIRRKRSRDSIILALVVAACTTFLIVYSLNK